MYESIVIGAGQAGLSASYHLQQRGIHHVVLDHNAAPGGAWQHRWPELTMNDVHRVAELPDGVAPAASGEPARTAVPTIFDDYERLHALPILRPVTVTRVNNQRGLLQVHAADGREWLTQTLVNATGTWTQPFVPHIPRIREFAGEQFHTATYPGREYLRGKHVIVVGAGASAVQFSGQLAPITRTTWVTRREPEWRTDEFTPEIGAAAVARVEERVAQGFAPASVVSVTGLQLREQEKEAAALGAYRSPRRMFSSIEPTGVRWADGTFLAADVILWATGFRPAVAHLAPLRLRSEHGGIQLTQRGRGTQAALDARVQLVGYGPSASTIGANRASRRAAIGVRNFLQRHNSVSTSAATATIPAVASAAIAVSPTT
ncbi:flavin-containing monooxygenase [Microbacterium sp. YY-01]|uniref:flavin-containing monooxygenase n=1 Tax=Microbacterium sp. YY-01 TaxID=3421634 RepID=UPI003D164331